MSELTPDDEALIHAARGGLEATPEDQARVKRRLFVQLGIATGVAGSAISTSTAASAGAVGAGAGATAAVGMSLTTKLFLAAIVIGATGGGVAIVHVSRAPSTPATAVTTSAPSPALPIENTASVVTAMPAPTSISEAPTSTSTPSITPAPSAAKNIATPAPKPAAINDSSPAPTSASTFAAPSIAAPPAVTPAASGPTTVDAESALLRSADAELKKGNANKALALVDQHATQFPNGILSEERDAERVVVLCALGRTDEARAAGAAFLRARPKSPLAGRVRASCGGN